MSPAGYMASGCRILSDPRIIIAYLCYVVGVSYAAEYVLPVQIAATLLVEPLVFSYIASRFFIEVVGPSRLPEHRSMRWRLYGPFMAIFAMLFAGTVAFQAAYFFFFRRDVPVSMPLLAWYGVLSTMVVFWMTGVLFCRGSVWRGLVAAFRLAGKYPAAAAMFFAGYFLFEVFHESFGFGSLRSANPGAFVILHSAYAFFDLYVTRAAVEIAALSGFFADSLAVLDEYVSVRPQAAAIDNHRSQMRRANVCLFLGCISFIPVIHLFAAVLGWKRFRNQEYGRFRSVVGAALGVFFTAIYACALAGNLLFPETKFRAQEHVASLEVFMRDPAVSTRVKQAIRLLQSKKGANPAVVAARLEESAGDQSQARYFALGLAHSRAYQPKEALAAFKKCLELPGWSPEVLFHIGRIHLFQTHDFSEARSNLVRFMGLRPDDRTAALYIALIDNRVSWDRNWAISLMSVIALLIAITCHEFGHSYAAYKCGDRTPKDAGRLSLNPAVHLDLFGSIILPASLILTRSGIVVGWAKPVPVNPENFRDRKRDTALVSAMGCCTNFAIAFAATIVLAFAGACLTVLAPDFVSFHWLFPSGFVSAAGVPFARLWIYGVIFTSLLIMVNIAIGVFNLIPIPPLDGAWVVEQRLRSALKGYYAAYHQFAFLLILVLLYANVIDTVIGFIVNSYFAYLQAVLAPALYLT